MSRLNQLLKHLPYSEAIAAYLKIKRGNSKGIKVSYLKHPFSLRNNPYDYATFEEVVLKKGYELELDFQPRNIIDGGGNIGLTAAFFASRYPDASIITIEPDQENFRLLKDNTAPYLNIKAMQAGIWHSSGNLVIENMNAGNNAFTVTEVDKNVPGSFPAIGIQDIVDTCHWPRIDILKLDVEGAEKHIFEQGTEAWLPKTKVLIIELHDRMKPGSSHAVFSAVGNHDFSFSILGENVVFTNNREI